MIKQNKQAFTLVELIVVITILTILATLAFINYSWNMYNAKKVKLQSNIQKIHKFLVSKLSMWKDINSFLTGNLLAKNWVNTGSTTNSWKYILWNLNYKVWNLNFYTLWLKWDNFKIETNSWTKDYIFSYVKTPDIIFYEIAGQTKNVVQKNTVIIHWNYYSIASSDAKWLISEKGFDIWLKNWESLTWSLY